MHLNGVDLLAFDNDTAATNDLCTDPETINYSAPPVYDEIEFDVTDILVPGEISYLVFESLSGYGSVAIDRLRVRVEPTSAPTTTTTTPMPATTTAMPTSTLIPTTMPTSTEAPTTAAPVVPDCVDPSDVSQLEGACTEFCEENVSVLLWRLALGLGGADSPGGCGELLREIDNRVKPRGVWQGV